MFQIAATYALALNNGDECAFDMDIKRTYHGVVHQGRVASSYFNSLYRHVKQLPAEWMPEHRYIEPENSPYHTIPYKENLLLTGYFQSEKYFEGRGEDIKKLFTDETLLQGLADKGGEVLGNSIALHIRRGDYVKFPDVHNILELDYYNNALAHIRGEDDCEYVLIFSDDIPWCRKNFKGKRFMFSNAGEDWEDIYLMSLCRHNIISNSSFSWWGAYLNKNEDKIVVAPRQWFNPNFNPNNEKIYTEDMVII